MALNYKGVPYKTEWLEYPDIEPTMTKLDLPPTGKTPGASHYYTLPVIHDPAAGKYVADSAAIAEHLEATYPGPGARALFPAGTRAAIALLEHTLAQCVDAPLYPLVPLAVSALLNPRGAAYIRATREAELGCALEELAPPGPAREARWAQAREGMTVVAGFFDKNGKDAPFFLGETFSYADIIIASFFVGLKRILGPDSDEWAALAGWDGGRWVKLVKATEDYQRT